MSITKIMIPWRPNTGPLQFLFDWPGFFIRGDGLGPYMKVLERASEVLATMPGRNDKALGVLAGQLREKLESAWVKEK